jgi:hypothetical protein
VEAGAGGLDAVENVQQVLQRARQTVELPDDDDIAFSQMLDHGVQARPIPPTAGRVLLVGFRDTMGGESAKLQRGRLRVPLRDPGVSDQHGEGFLLIWRAR